MTKDRLQLKAINSLLAAMDEMEVALDFVEGVLQQAHAEKYTKRLREERATIRKSFFALCGILNHDCPSQSRIA